MAAGLRGLDAGAHRQRRAQPAAARRLRRGHGRAAPGAAGRARRPTRRAGTCSAHSSSIWKRSGASPTRASGKCAAAREHFTYSKVMAWVAFDRAIKSAEQFELPGADRRAGARSASDIHDDVCAHGFDAKRGSFVQAYGSKDLDASLLLMPAVGFLPPDDPRIRGTVAAIERELLVDGLVLRYDTASADDGLPPGEGAVPRLQLLAGRRLSDARPPRRCARLFERLLALRNDLGLLSEEYDPSARRLVGNFPQAFSHIALVNTASNLAHTASPPSSVPNARRRQGRHAGRGLVGLLTARLRPEECRASPRRERPIQGRRQCSSMFGPIGFARPRPAQLEIYKKTAIRCSFATWASRFVTWCRKRRAQHLHACLGLRERRRPRGKARRWRRIRTGRPISVRTPRPAISSSRTTT